MLIDTHSHLFLEEFAEDLPQVMERARNAGVSSIFMPNIDSTTIDALLSVCAKYPDLCYPMIGLHPTSVNETYEQELAIVRERLSAPNYFVAIGEIGLDLYWDRTFLKEQLLVFERQIEWALEYELLDIELTKKMVDAFIENGFTYFDTAWMYCGFASENATKEVLVKRYPRDSYTLATKLHAGFIKTKEDRDAVFNKQLEKTGVEFFDYYLLHDI